MERNIKVFRAHRALSWLYLLLLGLFALIVFSTPGLLRDPPFLSLFFVILAVFFAHHLTARGARENKPWARVTSIIISLFLLIGFPLGTIIGIYLLANTLQPWSIKAAADSIGA